MVGREVGDIFPKVEHQFGEIVFEARGITAQNTELSGKNIVENINFTVRRGEVLGISGLMGAGRSELLTTVSSRIGEKFRAKFLSTVKKLR